MSFFHFSFFPSMLGIHLLEFPLMELLFSLVDGLFALFGFDIVSSFFEVGHFCYFLLKLGLDLFDRWEYGFGGLGLRKCEFIELVLNNSGLILDVFDFCEYRLLF
jgi:hypothetical protein